MRHPSGVLNLDMKKGSVSKETVCCVGESAIHFNVNCRQSESILSPVSESFYG